MARRKKPARSADQLSDFVANVASGDMPIEPVFRVDDGKNPAADTLRRMGKAKTSKGASPRVQRGNPPSK